MSKTIFILFLFSPKFQDFFYDLKSHRSSAAVREAYIIWIPEKKCYFPLTFMLQKIPGRRPARSWSGTPLWVGGSRRRWRRRGGGWRGRGGSGSGWRKMEMEFFKTCCHACHVAGMLLLLLLLLCCLCCCCCDYASIRYCIPAALRI